MILALLLQILCILAGILLLSLFLFAASSVHTAYAQTASDNQKKQDTASSPGDSASSEQYTSGKRAIILCNHIPPAIPERYRTNGFMDCHIRNMVFGGNLACSSGCLGLETCARACPNDAIVFRKGYVYISDACNGCGLCVSCCPKNLIKMVPHSQEARYSCAASGIMDSSDFCQTAKDGNCIDSNNFPESGFKILNRWGILKSKSR